MSAAPKHIPTAPVVRKRKRPDAATFAKMTLKKYPTVMAHLAE